MSIYDVLSEEPWGYEPTPELAWITGKSSEPLSDERTFLCQKYKDSCSDKTAWVIVPTFRAESQ